MDDLIKPLLPLLPGVDINILKISEGDSDVLIELVLFSDIGSVDP